MRADGAPDTGSAQAGTQSCSRLSVWSNTRHRMGRCNITDAALTSRPRHTVRTFTAVDVLAVQRLLQRPLRRLYPGGPEWLEARLGDVLDGRAAAYVQAEPPIHDGEQVDITGVAILTPKGAGRMKLSTIYVHPGRRREGVGAALLRTALLHAERNRVHETWVTVAHHVAHELFPLLSANGFTATAIEPDRYGPGRDEAVFTRLT